MAKKPLDDMKHWTGGKILLAFIKKNVKKYPKKVLVWRPESIELMEDKK